MWIDDKMVAALAQLSWDHFEEQQVRESFACCSVCGEYKNCHDYGKLCLEAIKGVMLGKDWPPKRVR